MNRYIKINKKDAVQYDKLVQFAMAYIDEHAIRAKGVERVGKLIRMETNHLLGIETRDGKI